MKKIILVAILFPAWCFAAQGGDMDKSMNENDPYQLCRSSVSSYLIWKAVAECKKAGKGTGPGGCIHTVKSANTPPFTEKDMKHCEVFKVD